MNTVLLLFSIGVFVFNTIATSENTQVNQVENTPREKPPKLLWDPDKRMWIESDDEDFYGKDFSGDDTDNLYNDFSFLDNENNQTDIIAEEEEEEPEEALDPNVDNKTATAIDDQIPTLNSSSNKGDCKHCDISRDIKTVTIPNPVLPTIPSAPLQVNSVGKAPVDELVKYEEKVSTSIDNPLNQALDLSTVKGNRIGVDTITDKVDESHANVAVEVNPATEYPLWALEFESKRTRPLQKESIKTKAPEPNIAKSETIGITQLQVLPLEDTDLHSKNTKHAGNSNITKNSPVFNIQSVSKESVKPTELPTILDQRNSSSKDKFHNIGVDVPEYHDSKQVINDTKVKIPVNTNIPTSDTNFEYNHPVITDNKQVQSTTTIEPHTEPSPEVVLPDNASVDNDTNVDKLVEKVQTSSNNIIHLTNVSGQGNITPLAPESKNNPTAIPSAVNETSASSQSSPILVNGSNANETSTPTFHSATCLPKITTFGKTTLHWPETPINVTTIPRELCLKEDGTPVTRTCLNSVWSAVNGTCSNVEIPTRTLILTELLYSTSTDSNRISKNLTQITSDTLNITSYQIHLMSKLLDRVSSTPETAGVDHFVETVSNIMRYQPAELRFAQSTLNSTDKILYSLDNTLLKAEVDENGYRSIVTDRLLVQKADLQKIDFSGFTLASSNNVRGFQANDVSALNQNMEILNPSARNMELALLIPEELRKTIKQCSGSRINPNIVSTVFYDDTLFNSNETQGRSEGKVISVLFPGFNCSFNAPLQIIFRPLSNSTFEQKCAYWRYGSNEQSENIKGQWVVEGKPKPFLNTSYHLCEFSHVTHFSLLLLGDLAVGISEADKKALDIITAVGSGLSLLGLLTVFLTAIAFKSYRSANAVVIHFSVAMAAQIVILFMADNAGEDKLMCIIFGAALHYVVLSQFCWMLTIALLQYKRYVLVFSNPTKYFMTKACAFAWGVPLIPVIVILIISTENYGRNSYGLCYAVGNYFIFGVLIPVAVIVFINLLVFLRIMIYIASRKIKAHRKMDNATSLQLRLAIMLYFLLGLTWGFGLIAAIGGGVVYSYLFCITATLQGFVLFLFFIALSEKTRSLWGTTRWCPCLDKKKKYDVNTDSSSHPMVRRPTSTNTSDTFTEGTGNDVFQKYKNRSSLDF